MTRTINQELKKLASNPGKSQTPLEHLTRQAQKLIEKTWPKAELKEWGSTAIIWATPKKQIVFVKTVDFWTAEILDYKILVTKPEKTYEAIHRYGIRQMTRRIPPKKVEDTPATPKQVEYLKILEAQQPYFDGTHEIDPDTWSVNQASWIIGCMMRTRQRKYVESY